jgi:serine/threonine protein kinase
MEFVDGEALDKVIRRAGRLEPSTALRVVTLVAAGLEAIEKQHLVHRDIKPSNIMVSLEGNKIVNRSGDRCGSAIERRSGLKYRSNRRKDGPTWLLVAWA